MPATGLGLSDPGSDCPLCPRLVEYRHEARAAHPDWFNAPVPSWGGAEARLLVVGLAPGIAGANRTGRAFTGDYAGRLLYGTLIAQGFAHGTFEERPDDSLMLDDCRITNSVRCVPPANKPIGPEIATCRRFLTGVLAEMPRLAAIVALGRIAHDSVVVALGGRPSRVTFGHGAEHAFGPVTLFDSYHCSRYNTSTGVLTPSMFEAVFAAVRGRLGPAPGEAHPDTIIR